MKNYIAPLRIKEIIGKIGFFAIGVFFSFPSLTVETILSVAQFLVLCLFNGIAIYLINAALGYQYDSVNTRLVYLQKIRKQALVLMGGIVMVVSLGWLYIFSHRLLVPALAIYFSWIIYSLPGGLKGIPIMGLVCAFIAQVFHFHLGYFLFSGLSTVSILLSLYFALLFTGGHALHEVIDYRADKQAGIKTSAVFFGQKIVFTFSNYLFTLAAAYLVMLAIFKILTWQIVVPYTVAFCLQAWFLMRLPENYTVAHLFQFRRKYMLFYLLATLVAALLFYFNAIEI